MPYGNNAALPKAVRDRYTGHCQTVFRTVYNKNASKGEGSAFAIAHTAAKSCQAGVREAEALDAPSDTLLDSAQRATPLRADRNDDPPDRRDAPSRDDPQSGDARVMPDQPISEAETKDGLPRKAFAYAPSATDTSTWKLPIYNADGTVDTGRLPAAAASLGEGGFRGQKVEIPAEARANVKSKLRAAYRKWKGRDAEYPDSIKEVSVRESTTDNGPALAIREATVLLDKSSVEACVVFAPNGDALVIPRWDGAFYYARKPWEEPPTPNEEEMDPTARWDAQDATDILQKLYRLKGNETEEPEQMALIDKAIAGILGFLKTEGDEIGKPVSAAEAAHDAIHVALEEIGKRNSGADMKRIQGIHDYCVGLGATCGIAEAAITVEGDGADIRFRESALDGSSSVVTLAEAEPVFDEASRTVTITPIRPGWGNKRDKFYYPAGTLKEATIKGLFNHIKMFRDHPTKSGAKELPERSVKDWFATTQEAVWDEVRQRPRLPIKVHEDADFRRFQDAPEQIAFSVLGGGTARPGKVDGESGRIVEAFHRLSSVDWVTEAGAGGAIDFAEAAAEEFDMELSQLTAEQLREGNPTLFAEIREAAIKEHDAEPEGEGAAAGGEGAEGAPAPEAAAPETPEAPAAEPTTTSEPVAESAPVTRAEYEALAAKIAANEVREAAAAALKEEFGKSTLPDKAKSVVAEQFAEAGWGAGHIYADEPAFRKGVQGSLAQAAALLANTRTSKVRGLGASTADGDEEKTASQLVEARVEERWGKDNIPGRSPVAAAAASSAAEERIADKI